MVASFLTDPARARARSLAAAILCAALSGCGFGLLMPLVALNLDAMTGSAILVGTNAAAAALSTMVATPFIPGLLAKANARWAIIASLVITGLGILAFPVFRDVTFWFLARFGIGIAVTVVFVASETWINQLAKPEKRASLLAVYATVLSAGFGSGGVVLALLGSEGWAPWIAGAAIYFLGVIPILILKGPEIERPHAHETGLKSMLRAGMLAPAAMLAGLLFGALETGFFALVPVYAERLGMGVTAIGLLVTTGALGALCLQIPVGHMADRIGRARMLTLIAAAAVVIPLAMAAAGDRLTLMFPLVFLYVGAASAFYTVGLALMGERVPPGTLATANAAFIFAYGLGSLLGPPVSGVAMDSFDPWGLMIAFSAIAALYFIALVRRTAAPRH
jgi:MFS family permease